MLEIPESKYFTMSKYIMYDDIVNDDFMKSVEALNPQNMLTENHY